MAELQDRIDKMNQLGWESHYQNTFFRLERALPFERMVEEVPYRFEWIKKKLNKEEGLQTALDIGCGNGLLLHLLKKEGFTAYGCDVSKAASETAKENVPEAEIALVKSEEALPYADDTFDVVTCLEVFEHVKALDKLIAEMIRVCKKGGKLLVTTPVGNAYDCPEHVRHFDFYSLCQALDPFNLNFRICRIFKSGKKKDNNNKDIFAVEVQL